MLFGEGIKAVIQLFDKLLVNAMYFINYYQ